MSPFEQDRNKKSKWTKLTYFITSTRTMFTLTLVVVLLGTGYIVKTNAAAGQGYEMKDLERNIRVLEHDNQQLELEIATLSSSKKLRERAAHLGFVSQSEVKYIATGPSVVARK